MCLVDTYSLRGTALLVEEELFVSLRVDDVLVFISTPILLMVKYNLLLTLAHVNAFATSQYGLITS